ncbi:MAG TPA: hypothetical protein PLO27_07640 [Marmoricola sp.]|nr:hypothetical protein [Marmoricola sp.]
MRIGQVRATEHGSTWCARRTTTSASANRAVAFPEPEDPPEPLTGYPPATTQRTTTHIETSFTALEL